MRADPYNPLSTKPAAGRFERTAARASWNAIGPALASFALFLLFATFAFGGDDASRSPPIVTEGSGRFVVSDVVPPPPPAPPAQDERPILNPPITPPGLSAPAQPTEPRQKPTSIGNESEGLSRVEIVPVTGQECPVDLSTALRLAEAENPTIALGREAIREALALQLAARGMMLPSLNAGAMYHRHQGALQGGDGQIEKVNLQSVYVGGGDWAVGSDTVAIPAVHIFGHVGDAYFAPLVAAQVVQSRSADSRGIENTVLLDVVGRYLDLLGTEAALDAIRRSEDNLRQVLQATAAFARTGQGRVGDYNRARTDALLLHSREERAQESVAVASAELARILHLDPSIRLQADPDSIEPVQLVDPTYRVEELIQIGRNARPEGTARAADISAAEYRLKQEYARPWLPLISVGYSAGGFGGTGSQASAPFDSVSGRSDFDVFAVWSFQNLGFGNLALQKERRSERDDALARRGLVLNQIGREIADAYARSEARRQQLEFAKARLKTATAAAQEEINRTRGGEALPLESINSVNLLVEARDEYIAALVGYDLAQFQLFVAIGQTPSVALPDPQKASSGKENAAGAPPK